MPTTKSENFFLSLDGLGNETRRNPSIFFVIQLQMKTEWDWNVNYITDSRMALQTNNIFRL